MNVDADCGVLTDRGKIEVNLLGMHLSQVKFDHAHTSDILRAKCTAEGILRHSKISSNVPLQVEKRLREVVREMQSINFRYLKGYFKIIVLYI